MVHPRVRTPSSRLGANPSIYNGLTVLDGTLTPQPSLAEEFTTQDARIWVFKLRKGVTFHDGKPLTPNDVVYSILRHKDPATASKAKVLADQIDTVKATGPNEVTITLTSPNADLPAILGTYHFHIVKEGTTDFNAGIGTGPYKVKEFKPGVRSIAVRNDGYWKPNRPYLDEIEFVGITDESARVNALLAGQVDLVSAVDPRSIDRIKGTGKYAVFETKAVSYTDLIVRDQYYPVPLPAVLGHEGAGVVEEVGRGVTSLVPGDPVVLSYGYCGSCAQCADRGQGDH